jgi:predicted DNA-binding helix-hairpin-helix protein
MDSIYNKGPSNDNSLLKIDDVNYKGGISLYKRPSIKRDKFVPAGQSTQMIIGATEESDYQIMSVSQSLYDNFNLKRVFYSAFVNVNDDSNLPSTQDGPPLLREHRLYQADWLIRFYGFRISELLTEKNPNFNVFLDPKCDWAIRHLEMFPVEVNKADYRTLLRVPGIGVNSARRIIAARKTAVLGFKDLKAMGIVLKRAVYFITCNGRMMYPIKLNEDFITRELLTANDRLPYGIDRDITYKQLSLFDDISFKSDYKQDAKTDIKLVPQRYSPI